MTERIFTATFAYQQKYTPPRCQLTTKNVKRLRGEVPVAITCLEPEEAPLVFVVLKPRSKGDAITRAEGGFLRQPFLYADGSLWRWMRGPGVPLTVENFESLLNGRGRVGGASPTWPDYPFPRHVRTTGNHDKTAKYTYENPFALPVPDEVQVRVWHESDYDAMRAQTARDAKDVLIVGDRLYRRDVEPRFVVARGYTNSVSLVRADVPLTENEIAFRIDRRDAALEALIALPNLWDKRSDPDISELPEIEMHRPDLLSFDDDHANACALFGPVVQTIGKKMHNCRSSDAIRVWCDLRDAADAYLAGELTAHADGIAALRRLAGSDLSLRPDALGHAQVRYGDLALQMAYHFPGIDAENELDATALATL